LNRCLTGVQKRSQEEDGEFSSLMAMDPTLPWVLLFTATLTSSYLQCFRHIQLTPCSYLM
jgi:hypothetical protein